MSSRKRKPLSLKRKLEILKEFDKGEKISKVDLAKKLNIPASTLKTIISKRKEIETNAAACGASASRKLRVQAGKFSQVEEIILEFFNECLSANIPISNRMLMEKANEVGKKLNIDKENGFTIGWVYRFKLRHGILSRPLNRKVNSEPVERVEQWFNDLPHYLLGYDAKNIFTVDETGLFYNMLPSKILTKKCNLYHRVTKNKLRITILLCVNSDGSEKLAPLVIGRKAKPKCFKNLKSLPLPYEFNNKSLMTQKIFKKWLVEFDKKMKQQNRKILLFMDQCKSHLQETDFLTNIQICFLPSNCISQVQPLDLGIIKNLKEYYRKKMVNLCLENLKSVKKGNFKTISLLQAMNFLSAAWSNVEEKTIQNCFKAAHIIQGDAKEIENIEIENWNLLDCNINFQEYVECDKDLVTNIVPTIPSIDDLIQTKQNKVNIKEEICSEDEQIDEEEIFSEDEQIDDEESFFEDEQCNEEKSGSEEEQINEEESSSEDEQVDVPTGKEAMAYIDKLRTFFLHHKTDPEIFSQLNKIENTLTTIQAKKLKQTKIHQFFKSK